MRWVWLLPLGGSLLSCAALAGLSSVPNAFDAGVDGGVDAPTRDVSAPRDVSTSVDGTHVDGCTGPACVGKALGEACVLAAQCASGFCADGVCCNTACQETCMACDQSPGAGTCVVAVGGNPRGSCTAGSSSTCQGTTCNDAGTCAVPDGTECAAAACSSGVATVSRCAGGSCEQSSTDCDGGCMGSACAGACSADSDCPSGMYCGINGSCATPEPLGASCDLATDCRTAPCNECASGNCVGGVCCNSACSGACESCSSGTCSAVRGGTTSSACGPYVCNGDAGTCPTSCTGDMGCVPGDTCSSGSCVAQLPNGTMCHEASDCVSGFCAQGYCCNEACTTGCESCGLPASLGTCSPIQAGMVANCSPYVCVLSGAQTVCATSCHGAATNCAPGYYCSGSACVADLANGQACTVARDCMSGFCVNGTCCASQCTEPCDSCGGGTCSTAPASAGSAGSPSCTPYTCDGTETTCPTSCSSNSSPCVTDYDCIGDVCEEAD